jgi:hypothetical protein
MKPQIEKKIFITGESFIEAIKRWHADDYKLLRLIDRKIVSIMKQIDKPQRKNK